MSVDERQLWHRFAGRIRGYGLRHLRDATSADDLVQRVLLAVLTAVREGRVEDLDRLDAYVLGTCRNATMDLRRGAARQHKIAERTAEVATVEHEPNLYAVDRMKIEMCLARLEARDRAVVLATFVEDRDADEIAAAMQLTAGNVRVIRHRALARLQACVEGSPS
jgi:RNA polymerase sigma-70 factor, ECF subfamily